MPFKSCTHVKADGLRCGSPALRGQKFCYFHHHSADHRPRTQARVVQIPFPENAAAIQVGIHNVMLAIIDRRLDERRASQLLWALQIAAGQGRQLPFDNNLLMSRTVTQLPAYEVEAEREKEREKEEERRILEQLRAPRSAPAALHTATTTTTVTRSEAAPQPTPVIPSEAAPQQTAVIPGEATPQVSSVIPSEAVLFGEVEGPAFPAHQQSASPNHPITQSPDHPIIP